MNQPTKQGNRQTNKLKQNKPLLASLGRRTSLALFCLRSFDPDVPGEMRAVITVVCCLLVRCLTSRQHVSVSQGRICEDSCTCCHTEIEAAHQTFHLTQSQYTDTGPTSPSADPITPGAKQGSHWSANFYVIIHPCTHKQASKRTNK